MKTDQHNSKQPEQSLTIVQKLNAFWAGRKYAFALWLEGKGSNYSKRKAIVLLAAFSVACAVFLSLLITRRFTVQERSLLNMPVISKIRPIGISTKKELPEEVIPPARLVRARQYLDSLAEDPNGAMRYDSLITARPGLMDSLKCAEHYYKQ